MSKKRLDRSAIEGGRAGRNKSDRYQSNAEVRQSERDFLKAVAIDPLLADEMDIDARTKVYPDFKDKLSPMYRWLEAQVGKIWADVRSEVFIKFDPSTTAGRHILFDHLLKQVIDTESGFDTNGHMANPDIEVDGIRINWETKKLTTGERIGSVYKFYVDDAGVLCYAKGKEYKRWRLAYNATAADYLAAEKWLDNRMIFMESGGKLFWCYSTKDVWRASWFEPPLFSGKDAKPDYTRTLQYYVQKVGNHKLKVPSIYGTFDMATSCVYWDPVATPYSYKQRGQLSVEDAKIFRGFKEKIKNDILAYVKGRK